MHQRAKEMLRARKASGRSRAKLGFRIYGPKGEVLREWTTRRTRKNSSVDLPDDADR
jgi:hypothetical protein